MSTASKQRSSTVKVGILTLVSLSLLVFSLIWLRGRGLAAGEPEAVYFRDVNGMREGSAVQMMGIRVGFVDSITPVCLVDDPANPEGVEKSGPQHREADCQSGRYYVKVAFNINKDLGIRIPKGSQLSIEQSGVIGEQFLEITPPQQREITLTTFKEPARAITAGMPVRFLYEEGYLDVGKVEHVEKYKDGNLVRHRLYYRITRPGAIMPEDPLFELTLDVRGKYYLRILPREPLLVQAPDPHLKYTIEDPLRMKRFLEIQMESAEALKLTNEKINQLLSDETIDSLQSTLKNTEVLTARANDVLESTNTLLQTTRQDLNRLVGASEQLANNVATVSNNLNEIIGDPKLKREMNDTIASLRESSNAMRALLTDPALKETIYMSRDTSKNAAELVSYLKQTATDRNLTERMDRIVTRLDSSMGKLNAVLDNVETLTDDKDQNLKGILEDTRAAARNMRSLTGKFSGRFTLFKLLF